MKLKTLATKTLVLWLSLAIGLPCPAFALRQAGLEENSAKPQVVERLRQTAAGLEEPPALAQNWSEEASARWGQRLSERLPGAVDDYQRNENFWKLTYENQEERLEKWGDGGENLYFIRNGPLFFIDSKMPWRKSVSSSLKNQMSSQLVWITSLRESTLGSPNRLLIWRDLCQSPCSICIEGAQRGS